MAVDYSSIINTGGTTSSLSEKNQSMQKSVQETKDQFLQLLITQLQNQDPLSPSDADQFTAQMMQMGQLEQLMTLNTGMETLTNAQSGSMIASYSNMVGKSTLASGNLFELDSAGAGKMTFQLNQTPKDVKVKVFDANGNYVRAIDTGISVSGEHTVNFDGLNNKGEPLPEGYYSYTVEAVDSEGNPFAASTYSTGRISSIRLENGLPIFQMGSNDLNLGDIKKVY